MVFTVQVAAHLYLKALECKYTKVKTMAYLIFRNLPTLFLYIYIYVLYLICYYLCWPHGLNFPVVCVFLLLLVFVFCHFNAKLCKTELTTSYDIATQNTQRKYLCVFPNLKNSSLRKILVEVIGYINQKQHFNVYVNSIA